MFHFLRLRWQMDGSTLFPALVLRRPQGGVEKLIRPRDQLALRVLRERRCVGYTGEDGTPHECPTSASRLGPDGRCQACQAREGLNGCSRCHGQCLNPRGLEHCQQPHIVYLAAYTPGFVKVGVSTEKRWKRRIAEQGAGFAAAVALAEDGASARRAESKIASELGFPSRATEPVRLRALRSTYEPEKLLAAVESGYRSVLGLDLGLQVVASESPELLDLYSPYIESVGKLRVPQAYSGSRNLYGEVVAVRGWSLVLGYRGAYSAFNLHRFVGFMVEEGGEPPRETLLDYP